MLIDFEGDECIGECGDEGRGFARRKFVTIVVMRQIDETIPSEFVSIEASTLIFILE